RSAWPACARREKGVVFCSWIPDTAWPGTRDACSAAPCPAIKIIQTGAPLSRTPLCNASKLAGLLPIQIDDGLDFVRLAVPGLERTPGLHDVGHFLHARQIFRRQRRIEGLGLDRLA